MKIIFQVGTFRGKLLEYTNNDSSCIIILVKWTDNSHKLIRRAHTGNNAVQELPGRRGYLGREREES